MDRTGRWHTSTGLHSVADVTAGHALPTEVGGDEVARTAASPTVAATAPAAAVPPDAGAPTDAVRS